jgi:hypothetical protein
MSWDNPAYRAYIAKISVEEYRAGQTHGSREPADLGKLRDDLDAITTAAKEHLSVLIAPRGRVARCLLRTLTRPGRRKVRDVAAYATASFRADPDLWRTIAVVAFDSDGGRIDEDDLTDSRGVSLLSRGSGRARGEEYDAWTSERWNPDGRYRYLDLRDSPDQSAA